MKITNSVRKFEYWVKVKCWKLKESLLNQLINWKQLQKLSGNIKPICLGQQDTIMSKNANRTYVQKTVIDPLNRECKLQKIAKEVGWSECHI